MHKTESSWSEIDSFVGNTDSPTLTAHRPCPVCGGRKQQTLLTFNGFQFFTDSCVDPKRADIHEVQCGHCHAIYLNPSYTDIGFSYLFSEAGQSYGSTEGRPVEQVEWLMRRGLLNEGDVFLDVGCYEGQFLSMLPQNVKRYGVDIDLPAVQRGNEKFRSSDVTLVHGPLERFELSVQPDIISMFHVLEHVANPCEVLRHLKRISHSETHLIVEVPILEYGKTNDINGFFSIQHMTHFSFNSLTELVSKAGWKVVERIQMDDYNGHRVMLTPNTETHDVKGEVEDLINARNYLAHWNSNLVDIGSRIRSWTLPDKVVIWGAGMHTEFLYQVTPFFQLDARRTYCLVDSDSMKQGKSWRGIQICSPDVLPDISWEDCALVISSYGGTDSIATAAKALGVPPTRIFTMYDSVRVY